MAKELNFNPRTLTSNVPSRKQRWNAPVKIWVRDLWEERQLKLTGRWPDMPKAKAIAVAEGNPMPEWAGDWHNCREFSEDEVPFLEGAGDG